MDEGYKCRIDDEAVMAHRLAEHLIKWLGDNSTINVSIVPIKGSLTVDVDEMAGAIEQYFKDALDNE